METLILEEGAFNPGPVTAYAATPLEQISFSANKTRTSAVKTSHIETIVTNKNRIPKP